MMKIDESDADLERGYLQGDRGDIDSSNELELDQSNNSDDGLDLAEGGLFL